MSAHIRSRAAVDASKSASADGAKKRPPKAQSLSKANSKVVKAGARGRPAPEKGAQPERRAKGRSPRMIEKQTLKIADASVSERAAAIRSRIKELHTEASVDHAAEPRQSSQKIKWLKWKWFSPVLFIASGGALVAADLPLTRVFKAPPVTEQPAPKPIDKPAPKSIAPEPLVISPGPKLQDGVYVTSSAAIAAGRSEHIVQRAETISHDPFTVRGPAVTLGLGYRKTFGDWVVGMEADHSWASAKGSTPGTSQAPCSASIISRSGECETTLRAFSTARLLVGRNVSVAMLYVTGGFAWGTVVGERAYGSFSSRHRGWTAGVGIEMPLTEKLSLKAEYLHLNLGSRPSYSDLCGCRRYHVSNQSNVFRIGINYSF